MRAVKIIVTLLLAFTAAAASAGLFNTGTVTTVRDAYGVRVELTGNAAGDLFDNLVPTLPRTRYVLDNGRWVDVIIGRNVSCAYFHPHRPGILRWWPAEFRCRVDVSPTGMAAAVSASEILKSIGVEN